MLATFASILPSGITFSSNNPKADTDKERDRREPAQLEIGSASANSVAQQSQGQIDGLPIDNSTPLSEQNGNKSKEMSNMSELGVKKKRERSANETFIVVRPPPSVSNHPLNLQLQLVPPQSKDRPMSRRSVDYASDAASIASTSASVARTGSIRSNRSDVSSFYSSSASMTSVSSFASSASSSGSGRRMIIPLYNLSAHNVMTNTVLDAGTDAKVAKFNKRGMEIIGLAVLEPLEVWNSGGVGGTGLSHASNGLLRVGSKDTADGAHAHFDDSAHTPTSSALSLSSAGIADNTVSHYQNTPLPPIPPEPSLTPTQSGAKKLFGRIFKKRDSDAQQQQSASSSSSRTGSLPVPISPLTKRSFATSRQPPASPTPSSDSRQGVGSSKLMSSVPSTPTQPVLRPPMLGIQSTVISPVYPPVGRPTRYVWVVRKWLKGNEGGLLGNVNNGLNAVMKGMRGLGVGEKSGNVGNSSAYEVGEGVEVRFEWARGTAKHTKRSSTIPPPPPPPPVSASSNNRRSSVHGSQEHALPPLPPELPERRLGAIRPGTADSSRRAPSPLAPKSREISGHGGHVSIVQPNEHERDRESINVSVEESEEGTWDGHTPTRPTSTREKRSSLRASREDDDGDESDPEDSETPWSCTLTVHSLRGRVDVERERERELLSLSYGVSSRTKPVGTVITPTPTSSHFSATSGTSSRLSPSTHAHGPQPLLKLKIATLSPAPHHPKVVAQLKVPFPLPDVQVDRAKARKRVIGPNGLPVMDVEDGGSFEDGGGGGGRGEGVRRGSIGAEGGGGGTTRYDGLMLTAEEIKDVLSSTAFWLVVREGLGGVGKVSRKGDGWRIRG